MLQSTARKSSRATLNARRHLPAGRAQLALTLRNRERYKGFSGAPLGAISDFPFDFLIPFLHPIDRHSRFTSMSSRGRPVNKSELIDAIARHADISKAAAGRALDATVGAIRGSLKKGDIVTLVGFGSFYVGKRTARQGRNPRTNEPIKIRAAKVPKFRAGKALKDALN
jgi:DNA-binding protein HU-beta